MKFGRRQRDKISAIVNLLDSDVVSGIAKILRRCDRANAFMWLCFIFWLTDDDSEPILGHWFEAALSPDDSSHCTNVRADDAASGGQDGTDTNETHRPGGNSSDSMPRPIDKKEPDTVSRLYLADCLKKHSQFSVVEWVSNC